MFDFVESESKSLRVGSQSKIKKAKLKKLKKTKIKIKKVKLKKTFKVDFPTIPDFFCHL